MFTFLILFYWRWTKPMPFIRQEHQTLLPEWWALWDLRILLPVGRQFKRKLFLQKTVRFEKWCKIWWATYWCKQAFLHHKNHVCWRRRWGIFHESLRKTYLCHNVVPSGNTRARNHVQNWAQVGQKCKEVQKGCWRYA